MSKKIYWVDIPHPYNVTSGTGYDWYNVGGFDSKEEAIKWIRKNIDEGCDDEGRIGLISMGNDDI